MISHEILTNLRYSTQILKVFYFLVIIQFDINQCLVF